MVFLIENNEKKRMRLLEGVEINIILKYQFEERNFSCTKENSHYNKSNNRRNEMKRRII